MPHADETSKCLVFYVNGKKVVDDKIDPEWTLLYYLRSKLRLCGTKLGCAEGGCGACTVMISKFDRKNNKAVHLAINACLAPVAAMHGVAVTTVEGIGSVKTKIHPVQERIAKAHGSQCGFCTPGFVMSMYALLRSQPGKPNWEDLEVAFQGNLCRCTGYRPIIEGFKTFTEEWEREQAIVSSREVNGINGGSTNGSACGMGRACCKLSKNSVREDDGTLFEPNEFAPYDPSKELIFPPELRLTVNYDNQYLEFKGPTTTWYRPKTMTQLLSLKNKYPAAKIINGNTEVGVEVKFKNCRYPVLINPNQVEDMTRITVLRDGIKVGAAVTLSDLQDALKDLIHKEPEHKTRFFKAIDSMLHWFAGKQIRNVAAIGGNIMTGSPISDLNPIFMAANCKLVVKSEDKGVRTVVMDKSFWTGYRRNIIAPNEVLVTIHLPFSTKNQHVKAFKQSKRREDDIAVVNGAFNLTLTEDYKISQFHVAYGGVAPWTVLATKTSEELIGMPWNKKTIEFAFDKLSEEIQLDPGAPGGMIQYRRSLTLSLLFKFYLTTVEELEKDGQYKCDLPSNYKSGKNEFHSAPFKSSQYYEVTPLSKTTAVGRPTVHKSALKQATGEALYCDDIPKFENELYLALVLSTRAHARILSIDASEALKTSGVIAFFSSRDIDEESNRVGPIRHDEQVFISDTVTSQGQIIGAIVAEDTIIAQRAAKLVKIEYEDLQPIIITTEDAIKHKSFFLDENLLMKKGDSQSSFDKVDGIVEGELKIGGQEHFYLETNATVAVPKGEDNEIEIISSTQNPTETQHLVAHVLGIPSNRVVCKTKRLGGGFGGKESRSVLLSLPVALAAFKLNRPVRAMLDRDEDMLISGTRHPFYGKYKAGFTNTGRIVACEFEIYNNAGYSYDLSQSVLERAMFHVTNTLYVENVAISANVCKTNTPSNTAFRGFGGPQGLLICETMVTHIASALGMDPVQIRDLNLIQPGQLNHCNQPVGNESLTRCWKECLTTADYENRKREIQLFNEQNRWRKRGITVVPTAFGISFTALHLNQAGALVIIYKDGSVLISHGGTEMGQGLHTKMIQVASRALGISEDFIHLSETSTDKVPNTSPTAASAGSDLNGMALLDACNKINERLEPIKKARPDGTWEQWINDAYFNRVSLSSTGFYKTPDINYNFKENKGLLFNYYTYGAACSEVEIDCLTGDHRTIRTDIVMDLGESLNPAIDIGQIEGAFAQGYGLFTLEELVVSPTGTLYSRGPGAYKLPGLGDVPLEFNVSLLKGSSNPRAVYSSKAIGEPPLFLASSVYFAIRDAVKEARKEAGIDPTEWFQFNSPATAGQIRMYCADEITSRFPEPKKGSYTPWNIAL